MEEIVGVVVVLVVVLAGSMGYDNTAVVAVEEVAGKGQMETELCWKNWWSIGCWIIGCWRLLLRWDL